MRTTKITIRSAALLAVVAGAGIAAQGCVIESSTPGPVICEPFLYVPWQVVQNVQGDPPITCATAGATSVELDVNGQTQNPQVCPANASNGTFVVPLADAGSYTVDGFLFSGNTLLSEVHPPTFSVGCADLTTPAMIFPVNL